MGENVPNWAGDVVDALAYPAVFATVSGAHLYGFASADSDLDLRGAHLLPVREVVGLRTGPETCQAGGVRDGVELDVVTHDLAKFCRLLVRPNGYVLEQLLSPLVVRTGPAHAALVALAPGLVTRHHAHHYLGFAAGQWRLFESSGELKPALYTLRVLLTGLHLMRTGEVRADLRQLCAAGGPGVRLGYVPDLIAAKRAAEHGRYADHPGLPDPDRLAADVAALRAELAVARDASALPERAPAADRVHELLVAVRLGELAPAVTSSEGVVTE
jgi:predicted nucleotidyltransferase